MFSKRTLVKINLFGVNALVVLMATAGLTYGIWMLVDAMSIWKLVGVVQVPGLQTEIEAASNWSYMEAIAIALIAACGLLLVFTICISNGIWKDNVYLLWIYMPVALLLGLVLLVVAILMLVFLQKVQLTVEELAVRALNERFDHQLGPNSSSEGIAWFQYMQTFHCCGWNGQSDFTRVLQHSSSANPNSTLPPQIATVPSACCIFINPETILLTGNKTVAQMADPNCPTHPYTNNSYIATGCKTHIQSFVQSSIVSCMVGAFVAAAVFFNAIPPLCLLICMNSTNTEEDNSGDFDSGEEEIRASPPVCMVIHGSYANNTRATEEENTQRFGPVHTSTDNEKYWALTRHCFLCLNLISMITVTVGILYL